MLSVILGLSLLSDPLSSPVTSYNRPSEELVITTDWRVELSQYPELEALAKCESTVNESAVNPSDSDGLPAYGLFQYKETTWEAFQKEMGVSGLDIMSGSDQLRVTKWAFSNNKQSHWGICL